MTQPKEHRREAEGICVTISPPWPRRVDISTSRGNALNGLSVKQAEGLYYALGKALEDAKEDDASRPS